MDGRYYSIPEIHDPDREGDWFGEGKAAMFLAQRDYLDGIEDSGSLESIDMVPVPIWKGNQDQGPYHGLWSMIIANYSEHKEWYAPYFF